MARVKIELPSSFSFSTVIPIRITDINYGGHVGNDTVLSLMHEARMQFLHHFGFTELNFGGTGMIMSDVAIEFKNELFYGDAITASVLLSEISKVSFALYYKLEKEVNGRMLLAATARTGMVCYNYETKKMAPFPEAIKQQFTQ